MTQYTTQKNLNN